VSAAAESARVPGCASDLELDELLAGDLAGQPQDARIRAHLERCTRCRDRFASFAIVEAPPAAEILSPIARARRGLRSPRRLAGVALALAAAAAFVLVVRPSGRSKPEQGGVRTKGTVAFSVFVKRATGAVDAIAGQGELRAGDEMRFSLATTNPGYAVVLGLDAAPAVTVYVPGGPLAATAAPVRVDSGGPRTLPGSIVADATAGDERLVAVVCDVVTAPESLRARALAALAEAHGRPELVGSLGTGCQEASVLMHKEWRAP
jgi:hypothetical protein